MLPCRQREVVVKAVVLVFLSAIATTVASGQERPATFKGGVDLVALNVVVLNKQQQFVGGLSAGSFAVYEDGVQQDVSFFASEELPLDLAILLDTSASMRSRLATAQDAAIGFISALRPVDRVLVIDIKDSSTVLSPLSHDIAAAKDAIRRTYAQGSTALYNGLYLTLREMTRHRDADSGMRRQAVVLLSDGDDTSSLLGFDDVMELAKLSGIAVYTIMLSSGVEPADERRRSERLSRADYAMKSLAQETGARSFFALEIADLAGVYKTIGEELASQYALGYLPTNQRRDGAYRRVSVRVIDRPNAQPRTRAGYLAPRG